MGDTNPKKAPKKKAKANNKAPAQATSSVGETTKKK